MQWCCKNNRMERENALMVYNVRHRMGKKARVRKKIFKPSEAESIRKIIIYCALLCLFWKNNLKKISMECLNLRIIFLQHTSKAPFSSCFTHHAASWLRSFTGNSLKIFGLVSSGRWDEAKPLTDFQTQNWKKK